MVVTELKYSNNLDSSEFDAIVIGKSLLHSHLQFSLSSMQMEQEL